MSITPMKLRSIAILAVLAPLFFAAPTVAMGASKPVIVHYMPWFQAKGTYSSDWGYHWKMGNNFNPNVVDASGKRQIASWNYPWIGPYDWLDPAVLDYHVVP